mmetsp:Transcript_34519/g.80552  ORF Transcript_34519/g.80552 Transcript_34519/m.80552 type:complete len:289 (-) Transcript_34519:91-957(-)
MDLLLASKDEVSLVDLTRVVARSYTDLVVLLADPELLGVLACHLGKRLHTLLGAVLPTDVDRLHTFLLGPFQAGRVGIRAQELQVQTPRSWLIHSFDADVLAFGRDCELVSVDVTALVGGFRMAIHCVNRPDTLRRTCRIVLVGPNVDDVVAGSQGCFGLCILLSLVSLVLHSDSFLGAYGDALAQRQPAHVACGEELDGLPGQVDFHIWALREPAVEEIPCVDLKHLRQLLVVRPRDTQMAGASIHHSAASAILAEVQLHTAHTNGQNGHNPVAELRHVDLAPADWL